MTQTTYNLNWQPGSSNKKFQASYTCNFSSDTNWLFYLRGSYNMKDLSPLHCYINNKTNNDLVEINGNNGQLVRQIPPYGEARIPLGGLDVLNITAPSGSTVVEFYNTPADEQIFQRTDTATSIIQVSGGLSIAVGDLVTIDRIGRIQVANAQPFSANNTIVDLQAGAAWPANPATCTFSANSTSIEYGGNKLATYDNTGGAEGRMWISDNAGFSLNLQMVAGVTAAYFPSNICETQTYLVVNVSTAASRAMKMNKTTGAQVVGYANGTSNPAIHVSRGLTTDNYYCIKVPGGGVTLENIVNDALVNATSIGNGWPIIAAGSKRFGANLGTRYCFGYEQGGNLRIMTFNGNSPPTSIDSNTYGFGVNAWRGNNANDPLICAAGDAYIPGVSGGNATIVYINTSGFISALNLASAAAIVCGCLSSADDLIIVWSNGGTINVRKYDGTTQLIATSFVPPACTNVRDILPFATDDVGGLAYLIIYNDAGTLRSFVINDDLTALSDVAAPMAIGGNAAAFIVWSTVAEFATVSTGTQPVVVEIDFSKSVFGVNRGGGGIQMTGFANLNQNFPGSTSFNQNAAAVIGNRGVVFNSTVQLQGLTP